MTDTTVTGIVKVKIFQWVVLHSPIGDMLREQRLKNQCTSLNSFKSVHFECRSRDVEVSSFSFIIEKNYAFLLFSTKVKEFLGINYGSMTKEMDLFW